MEFITGSTSYGVVDFYETFGQDLPKVVMINQPLSDSARESAPDKKQVIRLHCVSTQNRILAKVNLGADHIQILSLPVTFSGRACVVSEQATNDQWVTLLNVVANYSLPVSIKFSHEEFVTVENQLELLTVDDTPKSSNEMPAVELLKTFDEIHLLGNYILNGVLQRDVVHVPVHLSNLYVTTVKGIQGHSEETWHNFVKELDRATADIFYDQEFGCKDIASYDPSVIDTESWTYIKPANHFKKLQLGDESMGAHKPTPSSDGATYMSPSDSKTSTAAFNDFHITLTDWATSNLEKSEEYLDPEKCWMADLTKSTTAEDLCTTHIPPHVVNGVGDGEIKVSENLDGSEKLPSSNTKYSEIPKAMVADFTQPNTTDIIMSDIEQKDKSKTSKQLTSLVSEPLPSTTQTSAGIRHGSTEEAASCPNDCTIGVLHSLNTIDEGSEQMLKHCKELEIDCELLQISKDVPIYNDSNPKCPAHSSDIPLIPLDACVNTSKRAPPVAPRPKRPKSESNFIIGCEPNKNECFSLAPDFAPLGDDVVIIDRDAIKKMASIPNAGGIEKLRAKYVKDSSEVSAPRVCNSIKTNQSPQKHRVDERVFKHHAKVSDQNPLQSNVSSKATPIENSKLNAPTIRNVCGAGDVKKLTIDEVANYLKMLNLHGYIVSFRQQLIDGRLLSELDKSILTHEFGMKTVEAIRLMNFVKDGYIPS